jgi:MoaD family protein
MGGSMKVQVRYYAMLREAAGRRSEEVEFLEGSSFGDLMELVVAKYGVVFRRYVFDDEGRERDYLSFMVNGVSVHSRDGFDTPLTDGDVVAILPPVGGG